MRLTLSIQDKLTPAVNRLMGAVRNRDRLNRAMQSEVASTIREYVRQRVSGSHNTAQKLGAKPSNFVGKASGSIGRPAVQDTGFEIKLSHPYYARVFGDVTIRPTSGKYLTIPLVKEAYNQRARALNNLFVLRSQSGKLFLARAQATRIRRRKQADGTTRVKSAGETPILDLWYQLVTAVKQKQERERIPDDAALISAAVRGANRFFDQVVSQELANRGRANA